MKVEIKVPFEEQPADRIELFIRLVYTVIVMIVAGILGMLTMYIAYPLQFLYVLIFGKRLEILSKIGSVYATYMTSWLPYILGLTDEKADLIPKF